MRHDALRAKLGRQRFAGGIVALRSGDQDVRRHRDSRSISRRDGKNSIRDSGLIQIQILLLDEQNVSGSRLRAVRPARSRVVRGRARQCIDGAHILTGSGQARGIGHRGTLHDAGPIERTDSSRAHEWRSVRLDREIAAIVGYAVVKIKFQVLSWRVVGDEALGQAIRVVWIDLRALLSWSEYPAQDVLCLPVTARGTCKSDEGCSSITQANAAQIDGDAVRIQVNAIQHDLNVGHRCRRASGTGGYVGDGHAVFRAVRYVRSNNGAAQSRVWTTLSRA